MTQLLRDAVVAALDRVIDPCSVGRGLPAGLNDMGMVKAVEVDVEAGTAAVTLQLTSPACHFQLWFFERVREEVAGVAGVGDCTVEFSKDYDWSDESMSDDLKQRLQERRRMLTLTPLPTATG